MEPIFIAIFPFSAYMGTLQKNSVDRMPIKCNTLQFIKCQLKHMIKIMCHLKSDYLEIQ